MSGEGAPAGCGGVAGPGWEPQAPGSNEEGTETGCPSSAQSALLQREEPPLPVFY